MGKNQYTDLDKLFQSKLGEDRIASGEWNEPTDDMFFAAMEKVNEPVPSKKRRRIWPFFFVGFIMLLGLTTWNLFRVDELTSVINELQDETNSFSTSKITTKENVSGLAAEAASDMSEQTHLSGKQIVSAENEGFIKNNVTSRINNKVKSELVDNVVPTSSYNNILPPTYTKSSVVSTSAPIFNQSFAFNNIQDEQIDLVAKEAQSSSNNVSAFSLMPGLNGLLPVNNRQQINLGIEASDFIQDENKITKRAVAYYAFMDLNLNKLRMSGLEALDYTLSNYDKAYLGYDLGIGALQTINNRLSINYELGFSRVKINSLFANEMKYDESNVHQGMNGELVYDLLMDVQTPTGSINQMQSLTFIRGNIQDQDLMQQNIDIKQFYKFISLGVQPRIDMWSKNRLSVFAEAGLNLNYLVSFCQDLNTEMYYQNQMMMQNEIEDHSMGNLNRMTIAASAGLGLEYTFGEHLFSSFVLGSSRSLNSIRQTGNGTDDVRTYIDNLGVSLSAGYKF